MFVRHLLRPDDLAAMIASVFEYNQRGDVVAVTFYDAFGRPVEIGYAEAVCESPGLKVRREPEPSTVDKLARLAVGAEPLDPKAVPGPTSLAELAVATGEAP